jgi:hypothetical protein
VAEAGGNSRSGPRNGVVGQSLLLVTAGLAIRLVLLRLGQSPLQRVLFGV